MRVVDIAGLLTVALAVIFFAAIVARQRHMIRSPGAIAIATRRGQSRWLYGIGQYAGGELRWYRALGVGTRPTWILRRGDVAVLAHREPVGPELSSLPTTSVVVDLRNRGAELTIALSDGAFTGFVSWLEASAPRF